jgi:hypothetical protein
VTASTEAPRPPAYRTVTPEVALENYADDVTDRLRRLALSTDDSTALQGIKLWLERVYGRAVQPTRDETEPVNPLVSTTLRSPVRAGLVLEPRMCLGDALISVTF